MTRYRYTWSLQPSRTEGLSHVRLRVAWDRCRKVTTFLLGYTVDPAKWNAEASRVRANTTHGQDKVTAYVVNKAMDGYEAKVDDVMHRLDTPEVSDFREAFLSATGREPARSRLVTTLLGEWMKEHEANSDWSEATYNKYNTARGKMERMFPTLEIDNFTQDTMQKWVNSLLEEGGKNTSVARSVKILKAFLNWCKSKGLYKGDATEYKSRLKGAYNCSRQIVYLTWGELMKLHSLEGLSEEKARIRDCFCLMCFTSLRYSDVCSLKKSDIYDGALHVVTQKTSRSLTIELNDYSKEILDRYKGDCSVYAIPTISNQKFNDYIKVVARQAGITTPVRQVWFVGADRMEQMSPKCDIIGAHTGRHTFIVNALSKGISPAVIMKWTGHANWSSMKPYVDIVDSVKSDAMKLFNRDGATDCNVATGNGATEDVL